VLIESSPPTVTPLKAVRGGYRCFELFQPIIVMSLSAGPWVSEHCPVFRRRRCVQMGRGEPWAYRESHTGG
jgi:hypothetical protein